MGAKLKLNGLSSSQKNEQLNMLFV